MQSVDVRILGIVEYTDALEIMSTLQQQRIDDKIPDTLLFLEHPEIVTVGPRARNDGIAPPSDYRKHPVDRGGGLTWHGPGQLVVYPIIHWNKGDEKSVADIIRDRYDVNVLSKCKRKHLHRQGETVLKQQSNERAIIFIQ